MAKFIIHCYKSWNKDVIDVYSLHPLTLPETTESELEVDITREQWNGYKKLLNVPMALRWRTSSLQLILGMLFKAGIEEQCDSVEEAERFIFRD